MKFRLAEGDDDGSGGDEQAADEGWRGELFSEEEPGEEDDEGDAELVDGGDAGGGAELEGAEVAEPGEAGGEARKREKEQGAAI